MIINQEGNDCFTKLIKLNFSTWVVVYDFIFLLRFLIIFYLGRTIFSIQIFIHFWWLVLQNK